DRHDLLVRVDLLEPEHEIVGGERRPVAPLHAPAQLQGRDLTVRADLPAARDVWHDLGARVVPEQELVVLGRPVAVRRVERTRESPPPGAAVLADLAQWLDDERILTDALLHRRELARLHQGRQLRRLLEGLGIAPDVGDDLGALQLTHQIVGGGLRALGPRLRHEEIRQLGGGQREQAGSEHAPARWVKVRGLGARLHRVVVAHVLPLTLEGLEGRNRLVSGHKLAVGSAGCQRRSPRHLPSRPPRCAWTAAPPSARCAGCGRASGSTRSTGPRRPPASGTSGPSGASPSSRTTCARTTSSTAGSAGRCRTGEAATSITRTPTAGRSTTGASPTRCTTRWCTPGTGPWSSWRSRRVRSFRPRPRSSSPASRARPSGARTRPGCGPRHRATTSGGAASSARWSRIAWSATGRSTCEAGCGSCGTSPTSPTGGARPSSSMRSTT